MLLPAHHANAACWDQCYQDCGAGMVDDANAQTGLCTSRCTRYCTDDASNVYPRPVTVGPHVPKFGAIAVSASTMLAAYSYNFNSREEAEFDALKRCRDDNAGHPTDCQISLWFSDSCASLAMMKPVDGKTGVWSTALGGSRRKAEAEALAGCTKQAPEGCKVLGSFCSP